MKLVKYAIYATLAGVAFAFSSCDKSESYSELLRDQEKAVNWYLSGFRVEPEVPSDSVFETGENAPFYKMDEEGAVYMKVIDPGNREDRPKHGDRVFFRSSSMNLKNLYEAGYELWTGNSADLGDDSSPTSFVYGNYTISATSMYGTGIQLPLDYLGYDSRVVLVVKSMAGYLSVQTACLPYVMDVRYFRGIY